MRYAKYKYQKGQTLIALLFFVLIGIIVTTAAAFILVSNSLSASKFSQGEVARQMAETGMENALLQLLRSKNYTGETLQNIGGVAGDNVTITVTGTTTKTIDSVATSGNFVRKIEVIANSDDVLTPTSWKEIY